MANGAFDYTADDKTTFYGSLQQIYAVPSLDELYYDNQYVQGNRDLRPETGRKAVSVSVISCPTRRI